MKRVLTILVLSLAICAPTATAKAPPSFALWNARFTAMTDKPLNELADKCQALYGKTADRKIGECYVKGARVILRRQQPLWEKAVARISVGQTTACRKAIHAYWLTSRKRQTAGLIYLDTHPHRSITDIARDLDEEPYATLKSEGDAAKRRAIKICG